VNENQIYQRGLDEYGESPLALHWVDYRSMAIRFKNLVRDIEVQGRSVLDAGCGMGDLLPYLYARADNFDYLGVDINPGFIDIAKKRYEGHRFETGNPFSGQFKGRFDLVFSSGVMNINVKDWQTHRQTMIKTLFKLCRETLIFNMAGGYNPWPSDPLIAYASANEILEFCQSLTKDVELRADYLPSDFTIVMHKRL
jgi:SAM-dependent methyltransferase